MSLLRFQAAALRRVVIELAAAEGLQEFDDRRILDVRIGRDQLVGLRRRRIFQTVIEADQRDGELCGLIGRDAEHAATAALPAAATAESAAADFADRHHRRRRHRIRRRLVHRHRRRRTGRRPARPRRLRAI